MDKTPLKRHGKTKWTPDVEQTHINTYWKTNKRMEKFREHTSLPGLMTLWTVRPIFCKHEVLIKPNLPSEIPLENCQMFSSWKMKKLGHGGQMSLRVTQLRFYLGLLPPDWSAHNHTILLIRLPQEMPGVPADTSNWTFLPCETALRCVSGSGASDLGFPWPLSRALEILRKTKASFFPPLPEESPQPLRRDSLAWAAFLPCGL